MRTGKDLENVRSVLGEEGKHIKVISKVENQEGLVNFDQILSESDGVMVARGDLGMEIPTEKIFLAQKVRRWSSTISNRLLVTEVISNCLAPFQVMIKKCNAAGKPVVTATQMLVQTLCFSKKEGKNLDWRSRVSIFISLFGLAGVDGEESASHPG